MAKVGRPSIYTEELATEICERLADGESLRAICRDDHMPDESTVRGWALDDYNGFFPQYTRARTIQAHHMAEDALLISDDGRNDTYRDEDGNERVDHDVIARSRLRIDTRKWYLSKVLPKVYGDRTTADVNVHQTGTVQVEVTRKVVEVDPKNRIAQHTTNGASTNGSNGAGQP